MRRRMTSVLIATRLLTQKQKQRKENNETNQAANPHHIIPIMPIVGSSSRIRSPTSHSPPPTVFAYSAAHYMPSPPLSPISGSYRVCSYDETGQQHISREFPLTSDIVKLPYAQRMHVVLNHKRFEHYYINLRKNDESLLNTNRACGLIYASSYDMTLEEVVQAITELWRRHKESSKKEYYDVMMEAASLLLEAFVPPLADQNDRNGEEAEHGSDQDENGN